MADANPFEDLIPQRTANPFADLIPSKDAEPADHGLSERQKLSAVGRILSPVTGYPETYVRMNKDARGQFSRGVDQIANRESVIDPQAHGISDVINGVTNMGLGAVGYVTSPISAAYRSALGQPIEDATGIPREYTEFAAQLATPGIGLPGAVKAPAVIAPRVAAEAPAGEIVDAARRISAVAPEPINVPRAFASDNTAVQRTAQGIRNLPVIGDAIPRATGEMTDQLGNAVKSIASSYGEGSGPNVASRIGRNIGSQAEVEGKAASEAAANSDAAVLADWERAHNSVRNGISAAESSAADTARQAVGDMSPQDMGATLIARLRQGEQEARATKERLYGIAAKSDGAIDANAVRGIRSDVMRSLDESGVVVDPVVNGHSLTPAAARMVGELDNVAGVRVPGRGPAALEKPTATSSVAPASRPANPEAQSLTEFLASKGGLGPDSELEAIGAHGHTVSVEGVGRRKLVRQGGLPLDYAREAAEEAGYLRGDHKGTSTVNDLLDAIDAEMRGQKRYPEGFDGHVGKRERSAMSDREQAEYDRHIHGFESDLADAGHGQLGPDVKARAVRLMSNEGMDADTAVEHALSQLEQEDVAGVARSSSFPGDRPASSQAAFGDARSVNMQTIEQTRKRLNSLAGAASNDADRRAARHVIKAFDESIGNAFDNALFSGSDEALQSYRAARAANADWRTRFGFNQRDDADRIVNRIVTGEVTPQEVSNYIVGASKVGAKGVSSRLMTKLAEATGGDPEALQAIRGGVWNRLSQTTEGTAAKPPAKIIDDINEFLQGSGRDVANRLFTSEQQGVMRAYANTLRRGGQQREILDEAAKNTKPSPMKPEIGPMQELANAVLGKNGKSDEALFNAINSYAKAGGRSDVQTLSDIVRSIPEKDRGDLAGSIIRNLGQSKQTGGFSLDLYASEWAKYTPQAKDILFGNSGSYRTALDDIAKISQRYKDIGKRFGNPSGTAQNANLLGTAVWAVTSPFTAIPTLIGAGVAAKMLSAPAGASSLAKWGNAYQALQLSPNPQRLIAFQVASRNLSNTASGFGANVDPASIMRLIQSPGKAAADDQQSQVPRRVGQ
jgi:hypothetical protein